MTELFVSSSPHLRDKDNVPKIMYMVIISLIPALIGSVYFFGLRALWLTALAVTAAIATEWIIVKLTKKPSTIYDGSAIVTGILLAYNLPAGVPWWIPVLGSVFAIGIGKMPFGGLGYNPMNPALLGRAFLLASWPVHMTTDWTVPAAGTKSGISLVTDATPLTALKGALRDIDIPEKAEQARQVIESLSGSDSYLNLFIGKVSGCIGETSVILLLIGAAFLMFKKIINYRIPFSYIATVAILGWIFGGPGGLFSGDPLFHVLAGGLILGAFFMATDMVTSPITPKGQFIFGIGCGIFAIIIRIVGGYPEGVSYSILLMNLTVPLIDKYSKPKIYGG